MKKGFLSYLLSCSLGAWFGTAAIASLATAPDSRTLASSQAVPAAKKILVVVLENEDYDTTLKQSFLGDLVKRGALLTNYGALTHPSQPNYIGLVSGSTEGVPGNSSVTLSRSHIGALIEQKGKSWKSYVEGYPGGCNKKSKIGRYVRKHSPFISFKDVQKNPERCARIVNSSELDKDFQKGQLPDFSFYVPDLDNDGHDTGIEFADRYMAKRFQPFLDDKRFTDEVLFVVTFDEGRYFSSNQVYTILVGPKVKPGITSKTRYTHYSLLRTIEEALGLGSLGRGDRSAQVIGDIWN